jgi:hypothetical protein
LPADHLGSSDTADDAAYQLLSVTAAAVGLLAWIMWTTTGWASPPLTVLSGLADVLLCAGLLMSVVTLVLAAVCSFAVAVVGPDLLTNAAVAWLPVAALIVAALEVILAVLF